MALVAEAFGLAGAVSEHSTDIIRAAGKTFSHSTFEAIPLGRRCVAPIGNRFHSDGGGWIFEKATGWTYLCRSLPLDTPPAAIERMVEMVPARSQRQGHAGRAHLAPKAMQ